jgi:acyl carrier protein
MNPKLKKIFIKIFGNKSKITADSNMNNVKKWDSLNHIKLMFELEKIKKKNFQVVK